MASEERGVILDSSVWIAFLHEKDSQHAKAKALFAHVAESFVVPEYVLIEVATTLRRKKKDAEAKRFVRTMLENGNFLPADSLAHRAAELFCSSDNPLSFTDIALVVLSREYRVVTFDKALARALA